MKSSFKTELHGWTDSLDASAKVALIFFSIIQATASPANVVL